MTLKGILRKLREFRVFFSLGAGSWEAGKLGAGLFDLTSLPFPLSRRGLDAATEEPVVVGTVRYCTVR